VLLDIDTHHPSYRRYIDAHTHSERERERKDIDIMQRRRKTQNFRSLHSADTNTHKRKTSLKT
jgi:hypothetical protein